MVSPYKCGATSPPYVTAVTQQRYPGHEAIRVGAIIPESAGRLRFWVPLHVLHSLPGQPCQCGTILGPELTGKRKEGVRIV